MRLNAKRVLLIEPDEFQALIFADLDKYYDPFSAKFGRFERTIETPLGCDIDLDIKYSIQIDITWSKYDREATIKFQDLGAYEVTAWYGGDEIEHCICWTDSQYEQFIKNLKDYIEN